MKKLLPIILAPTIAYSASAEDPYTPAKQGVKRRNEEIYQPDRILKELPAGTTFAAIKFKPIDMRPSITIPWTDLTKAPDAPHLSPTPIRASLEGAKSFTFDESLVSLRKESGK